MTVYIYHYHSYPKIVCPFTKEILVRFMVFGCLLVIVLFVDILVLFPLFLFFFFYKFWSGMYWDEVYQVVVKTQHYLGFMYSEIAHLWYTGVWFLFFSISFENLKWLDKVLYPVISALPALHICRFLNRERGGLFCYCFVACNYIQVMYIWYKTQSCLPIFLTEKFISILCKNRDHHIK